jgi:hypothetical protein
LEVTRAPGRRSPPRTPRCARVQAKITSNPAQNRAQNERGNRGPHALCPGSTADATGFEPAAYASGDQCTSEFPPVFPGYRGSSQCAVARESVPLCAPVGLVIPPHIAWLASRVSEDPRATEREVDLARWLLSRLQESGEG